VQLNGVNGPTDLSEPHRARARLTVHLSGPLLMLPDHLSPIRLLRATDKGRHSLCYLSGSQAATTVRPAPQSVATRRCLKRRVPHRL